MTHYKQTAGSASASLVLGILGLFLVIPALPAIICGHVARAKIRKQPEAFSGNGMALAGLIMGYGMVVLLVGGFFLFGVFGDRVRSKMGGATIELGGDQSAVKAVNDSSHDFLRSIDKKQW